MPTLVSRVSIFIRIQQVFGFTKKCTPLLWDCQSGILPVMTIEDLQKKEMPDVPGVYFFLDASGTVLYIGKATSLRSRVRSYFSKDVIETRGPMIVDMVFRAADVKWQETDSVLEALILEAALIKKHQPMYNVKEKDDKSFNYVVITKEPYPRVLLVRGRTLAQPELLDFKVDAAYGPFPQGGTLKEAMKIIRRIFPYRDACQPESGKPCFNAQIGLCPGVCDGRISKEEYRSMVRNIKLFFEGKKKQLLRNLEKEMKEHAKRQEFEKAEAIKRRIFALQHIQDVALIKQDTVRHDPFNSFRVEAYDIAHQGGSSMVGVMTVVTDGKADKAEYRKFKIRSQKGANDTGSLREVLERRFGHLDWGVPDLLVMDGGAAQKNAAERFLSASSISIPVVSVVKDERHQPKGMLGDKDIVAKHEAAILLANSEAHRFAIGFHRQRQRKRFLPE